MIVLRTDFSDDAAWNEIYETIITSYSNHELEMTLDFISDPSYANITRKQVLSLISADYAPECILVVDHRTIVEPSHPIIAMSAFEEDYREEDDTANGYMFRISSSQAFIINIILAFDDAGFGDLFNFNSCFFESLRVYGNTAVVRTDFSDDGIWYFLCYRISKYYTEFELEVTLDFISDPMYNGLTPEQIVALIPKEYNHGCVFIVDHNTITHPAHWLIAMKTYEYEFHESDFDNENDFKDAVDLYMKRGDVIQIPPSDVCDMEINLSLANMDFEDFASATDERGNFTGF